MHFKPIYAVKIILNTAQTIIRKTLLHRKYNFQNDSGVTLSYTIHSTHDILFMKLASDV